MEPRGRTRRRASLGLAALLTAISRFIDRGVKRGEFRKTAVNDLPQVVLAPMMLSMIWRLIFAKRELDTDKLMETQIDMLLAWIKA